MPKIQPQAVALAAIALFVVCASETAGAVLRIVGGTLATQAWPAHAHLRIQEGGVAYTCGGTLVAPRWVVTAAHCVTTINGSTSPPGAVTATLGSSRLDGAGGTVHSVARVNVHSRWRPSTGTYDVALLELQTAATQRPLAVISSSETHLQAPGRPARILGWGYMQEGGALSPDLRQADVPIASDADCDDANSYDGVIVHDVMICAGYPEGGRDACQGDSGGPLMVDSGQRPSGDPAGGWRLAGVVSAGDGCARPNKYGIYTELANSSIRSWMAGKIGSAAPPPPPPAPPPPSAPSTAPKASLKYSGDKRVGKAMTYRSTSTHPQGSSRIVALDWDLDSDGAYDDASGAKVKWTYSTPGDKVVRLRVTDDDGDVAIAQKTVAIKKKKKK